MVTIDNVCDSVSPLNFHINRLIIESDSLTLFTTMNTTDYVLCISKPLTYDQLGDMYQEQTGQSARTKPLEFVREWAENNSQFYVCPIETTIHKIGYAKPMPVLDN
jgi:hypothetical protein